jgi:hypothetical protein
MTELITPERQAFIERATRLMDAARLTGAASSAYFLDKCNAEDQATPEQRKDEVEAPLSGKSSRALVFRDDGWIRRFIGH